MTEKERASAPADSAGDTEPASPQGAPPGGEPASPQGAPPGGEDASKLGSLLRNAGNRKICKGVTKRGRACTKNCLLGEDFCEWHHPDRHEVRRARQVGLPKWFEPATLTTREAVQRTLERVVDEARSGRIEAAQGNLVIKACETALKALPRPKRSKNGAAPDDSEPEPEPEPDFEW